MKAEKKPALKIPFAKSQLVRVVVMKASKKASMGRRKRERFMGKILLRKEDVPQGARTAAYCRIARKVSLRHAPPATNAKSPARHEAGRAIDSLTQLTQT